MNNDKFDILDILAELHHKGRNHQMGRDFYDWISDGDGKVSEQRLACCNYAVIMFNTKSLFVILVISEAYRDTFRVNYSMLHTSVSRIQLGINPCISTCFIRLCYL